MKQSYFIPENFAENGKIGPFQIRNVIEASVIGALIMIPEMFLPIGGRAKLYTAIITVLPLVALALIGINGLALTEFAFIYVKHRKNKRVIKKPQPKDVILREKALLEKRRQKQKALEKEEKQRLKEEKSKNKKRILKKKVEDDDE